MCLAGQAPATTAQAVAMVQAGLGWLATADAASLPAAEQAECLRGLEQAASMHTAPQSRVLGAFAAQGGYEDDEHGSARTWLTWQIRVTGAAGHPAVGDALAGGKISESGPGRSATGPTSCPKRCAAMRM